MLLMFYVDLLLSYDKSGYVKYQHIWPDQCVCVSPPFPWVYSIQSREKVEYTVWAYVMLTFMLSLPDSIKQIAIFYPAVASLYLTTQIFILELQAYVVRLQLFIVLLQVSITQQHIFLSSSYESVSCNCNFLSCKWKIFLIL